MRRAFPILIFLTLVLAWPAAAHAQLPAGCTAETASHISLQSETKKLPNPKTGDLEDHLIRRERVELTCQDVRITADEVDLVMQTNTLTATGNVVFNQQGMRITATRAVFDLKTKTGVFYVASGTLAMENTGGSPTDHKMDRSLFGYVEPDAYFYGEELEKLGPRTYRLTKGAFTTCVQPTPRWEMATSSTTITVGDHAVLHNMTLKAKSVPVFYLPVLYYPIHGNERASGFLMPTYGSSSVRGFTLSNAFFWALGRSRDATFYHDWFSRAGQGFGTEYRYAADHASSGSARVYIVHQKEQLEPDGVTVSVPSGESYDFVADGTQSLGPRTRVQGRANYFSNVKTQQLLQQNVYDLSNRDRYFGINMYTNWGKSMRLAAQAEVHDYFYGSTDATRYGSAPRVNFTYAQTPLGHSRIYVGFGSEYLSTIRQAVVSDATTNTNLQRIDLNPTIRAPLGNWSFLSINTSAAWRFTSWSESLNPEGAQVNTAVNRSLFVLQANVNGPVFTRIFDTPHSEYADRFKHLIEPTLSVKYVTPFSGFDNIVKLDGVDNIVGGATSLTYGLANHVLARRRLAGGESASREIAVVGISQSYYTDQNAAAYDQQYQSSEHGRVPSSFSPIALQAAAVVTDRVSGQSRLEYDLQEGSLRTFSAGSNVDLSMFRVNATYTRQFLIPTLPGFDVASALAHSVGITTAARARDNHLTAAWSWNYDFTHNYMLQQRVSSTYNTQCCGVAVEYQTVFLGSTGPNGITHDRRFNISFTLAGLGTFQNPLGGFGGAK